MSSPVRLRRLMADYKRVAQVFKEHQLIRVKQAHGNPPERYEVEYRVKGLVSRGGNVEPKGVHLVEIVLPLGYPRQAPVCRMLTPVFHPNIAPHAVCIGDHWAAGESLVHLIVRIGELLAYQSYNIKSPLNGEAARWAEQHASELPVDRADLSPVVRPEDIQVRPEAAEAPLPVAKAIPVARAAPAAPAVPVAIPVAKPVARKAPAVAVPAGSSASVDPAAEYRLTCTGCGRERVAGASVAASPPACIYCGGKMIAGPKV